MFTPPRGTISVLHHRPFARLGNSNEFYLTILARELALDTISFPSSPTSFPPCNGIPNEIAKLHKEFANTVPDELPDELPPLRDIQHAIDNAPPPRYRLNPTERVELNHQVEVI